MVVPDDRNIVIERVQRRARRLAGVCADAVWKQSACSVGDGGDGEVAGGERTGSGDDVVGGRFCAAVSGDR